MRRVHGRRADGHGDGVDRIEAARGRHGAELRARHAGFRQREVFGIGRCHRLAERNRKVDMGARICWIRIGPDDRYDGRSHDLVGDDGGGPLRGGLIVSPNGPIGARGVDDLVCRLRRQLVSCTVPGVLVGQIRDGDCRGACRCRAKAPHSALEGKRADEQFVRLRSGCGIARTRRGGVSSGRAALVLGAGDERAAALRQ